nr:hypothetical protein [Tanacetum cinerariifolium]
MSLPSHEFWPSSVACIMEIMSSLFKWAFLKFQHRWRRGCGGHGGVLVSAAGVGDEASAWIVVAVGGCGAAWRGDSGGGVWWLTCQTHPFLVVLLRPWCCRWRRGCGGHGGVLVSAAGEADETAAWIVVAVGGYGAVWRGDSGGGVWWLTW